MEEGDGEMKEDRDKDGRTLPPQPPLSGWERDQASSPFPKSNGHCPIFCQYVDAS